MADTWGVTGNPHPLFGPYQTAEQRFQLRFQQHLIQNGIFMGAGHGHGHGHGHVQMQGQELVVHAHVEQPHHFVMPEQGQANYQAFLRAEGLRVSDGIVLVNNLVDSPMTAWNDMMSDASTGSTEFVLAEGAQRTLEMQNVICNFAFIPDCIPSILAKVDGSGHISLLNSVLHSLLKPNLFCDAKQLRKYSGPPISFVMTSFKRVADHDGFIPARRVVRKLCFEGDTSASLTSIREAFQPAKPIKRGRKPRSAVPVVTSGLHRSPRTNIYKGFKVTQPSDCKKHTSKVKGKVVVDMSEASSTVPALISVEDLQKIGRNYCAIPDGEITSEKLLAETSKD